MLKKNLNNWERNDKTEALLFFAQLLDEKLFHYTIDRNKPTALNIIDLLNEYYNCTSDVNNVYDKAHKKHIREEILDRISKDITCINILGDRISLYKQKLSNDETADRTVLLILEKMVNAGRYVNAVIHELATEIKTRGDKAKIASLSDVWLSVLIGSGYSKEYLYSQVNSVFFSPTGERIAETGIIDQFLTSFEIGKKCDYIVYHKIPKLISALLLEFGVFDRKIEEADSVRTSFSGFFSQDDSYEYFEVKIDDKPDEFSARVRSLELIELALAILCIYHHKPLPSIPQDVIVKDLANNTYKNINSPVNITARNKDYKIDKASKRAIVFQQKFAAADLDTYRKIISVMKLHNEAIRNNDKYNKLLNLWVSIEILLYNGQFPKEGKVDTISRNLCSFLSYNYHKKILSYYYKDIKRWMRKELNDKLSTVTGGRDNYEKLIIVMIKPDHQDILSEILIEMNEFPLLKYRTNEIIKLLKPENFKDVLAMHKRKVNWHIRRIYRARNLFVHDGKQGEYIEVLIENLHEYLDIVFSTIMNINFETEECLTDLSNIIAEIELRNIHFSDKLEKIKNSQHDEIIKLFLG